MKRLEVSDSVPIVMAYFSHIVAGPGFLDRALSTIKQEGLRTADLSEWIGDGHDDPRINDEEFHMWWDPHPGPKGQAKIGQGLFQSVSMIDGDLLSMKQVAGDSHFKATNSDFGHSH